jgi:hypothetical protein
MQLATSELGDGTPAINAPPAHYHGVGRPFNGFPLFLAILSSSFACHSRSGASATAVDSELRRDGRQLTFLAPTVTGATPPYCAETFINRIGRFPTYFPSISFHALSMSSGSLKAMKPYLAWK